MDQLIAQNNLTGLKHFLAESPNLTNLAVQHACSIARLAVVDMLVSSLGATVRDGCLIPAIVNGDFGMVQFLVEHGANINEKKQEPAVEIACRIGNTDIIKYLIEKGAEVNKINCLFLSASKFAHHTDSKTIELLYSIFKVSAALTNQLFFLACKGGRVEVAQFLVSKGAQINHMSVILAAETGSLEMVEYLCEAGADVRGMDNEAIKRASANDRFEVVRYLVEAGADRAKIHGMSRSARYLALLERTGQKMRVRAQKKIYFWWIPICYDPKRACGKRMMARSWEETQALMMAQ